MGIVYLAVFFVGEIRAADYRHHLAGLDILGGHSYAVAALAFNLGQAQFGLPVGNGILTTHDEAQAIARFDKGAEAVRVALEMARLRRELADRWR